jgi:alkylation response protein AidB-like acyl-CoA dehydrogenase
MDDVALGQALDRIRDEASACEQGRRLTPACVKALRDTGVFAMTFGKRLGGPELDPIAQIELLEKISMADPSAGWCAMIGSDGGYATAWLDEATAKDMYPSIDTPTALNANPNGQAKTVDGGYQVSGRWPFASGSTHSEWFFLHCLTFGPDESMMMGDDGVPAMRFVGVPRDEVEIVDTWTTTGLAGSGSHDIVVSDVFVPEPRTYSLLHGLPVDPSPLYAMPWMFFVNLAAVPLGLGRVAIEESKRAAAAKFSMATMSSAADDPLVAVAVARAEGLVGSARAYLLDTVGSVWERVGAGEDCSEEWTRFRVANTHAFHAVKEAVNVLYEALGTTGVYRTSPLDRWYRDVTTMSQHVLTQPKSFVAAGRALLGLDPQAFGF